MTGAAVVPADRQDRQGITALLNSDSARARIEPHLRGVDYRQVMGEVYLACSDNPEILTCTPASIIRAVARACQWGLVCGETVHLVPFNVNVGTKDAPRFEKRVKPIQDYKGKIELILATGSARAIDAQCVYENEPFEHVEGTNPFVVHRPAHRAADRGALLGAYAIATHGHSGRPPNIRYVPLEDVDAIRKTHSKQWKAGPCPPWYAMKTAVHQLAKLLPRNPKLAAALRFLDSDETEIDEQTDQTSGPGRGDRAPVATVEAPLAPALASTRPTSTPAAPAAPATREHEQADGDAALLLDDRWVEEQDQRRHQEL